MTTLEFSYSLDRLTRSLKPFALRLTKDRDDANDLIQDTVLKAFTNRDKFSDGTNLKAWLFTIMKNTFITNYQKMLRRATFVDTTDNQHYLNSGKTKVENQAYGDFALEDIQHSIGHLDPSFRTPFMMHFKGYKYEEIAQHLDIPIGTVKNRIHVARKKLKENLSIYKYD
ncbi:RNA polymerase sigma factor [Echinicola jeungdonensis]|uniref:RNA polymerase sigma factor n=1 Tax=Echinicola jeungdonensis TaxID=709343 RepID=A0ABV5J8R1_9BACT|nr:RNA polymerase sigma factor [Echinicola jeungdonensis]MDN3669239.1 RNA polymerase sigma factor [Echinicola jeungdonensis]